MNDEEKKLKFYIKYEDELFEVDRIPDITCEINDMVRQAHLKRIEQMENDAIDALSKVFSQYGEAIEPSSVIDLVRSIIMLNNKGIDTPDKVYELLNRCEKEGIL